MNAYMVVIRYSMDDIPVLFTADEDKAMECAASVKPTTFEHTTKTIIDGDDRESQRVLGLDATEPLNVSVFVFTNGKLTENRQVQDFT